MQVRRQDALTDHLFSDLGRLCAFDDATVIAYNPAESGPSRSPLAATAAIKSAKKSAPRLSAEASADLFFDVPAESPVVGSPLVSRTATAPAVMRDTVT